MNRHARYISTLIEEKDIDLDANFTVEASGGTSNLMTYRTIVDAILSESVSVWEQERIADTMRRIDFKNGDICHFLRHLAGAIAIDI